MDKVLLYRLWPLDKERNYALKEIRDCYLAASTAGAQSDIGEFQALFDTLLLDDEAAREELNDKKRKDKLIDMFSKFYRQRIAILSFSIDDDFSDKKKWNSYAKGGGFFAAYDLFKLLAAISKESSRKGFRFLTKPVTYGKGNDISLFLNESINFAKKFLIDFPHYFNEHPDGERFVNEWTCALSDQAKQESLSPVFHKTDGTNGTLDFSWEKEFRLLAYFTNPNYLSKHRHPIIANGVVPEFVVVDERKIDSGYYQTLFRISKQKHFKIQLLND